VRIVVIRTRHAHSFSPQRFKEIARRGVSGGGGEIVLGKGGASWSVPVAPGSAEGMTSRIVIMDLPPWDGGGSLWE
jgi:hypothetical protein